MRKNRDWMRVKAFVQQAFNRGFIYDVTSSIQVPLRQQPYNFLVRLTLFVVGEVRRRFRSKAGGL